MAIRSSVKSHSTEEFDGRASANRPQRVVREGVPKSRPSGSGQGSKSSGWKPAVFSCLATLFVGAFAGWSYLSADANSSSKAASSNTGRNVSVTAGNSPSHRNTLPGSIDDAILTVAASPANSNSSSSVPSPQEIAKENQRRAWVSDTAVPFLNKYCVDCHGPDEQSAGITLDGLQSPDQFLTERKNWERVYRMVNAGAMPPSGHDPFPTTDELSSMAEGLYDELYNFDCELEYHAGRPTVQRLNRAEYNNTIRDLFGIDIKPAAEFPQDDVGEGFDNIGDVLSLPPLLMEKYLDAAEKVSEAVIDLRDFSKPQVRKFRGPELTSSLGTKADGRGFVMLQTNGSVSTQFEAPADGRYRIRVECTAHQAGPDKPRMAVRSDEHTLFEFDIAEGRRPEWNEQTVDLKKGLQTISAAFLNDFFDANAEDGRKDRNAMVRTIEIVGPEGGMEPEWHDVHRRFVTIRPSETVSVQEAASQVLTPILRKAFRRRITEDEVARFASLTDRYVNEMGESYDYGLSIALQAILVSPDFLFRIEPDPAEGQSERSLTAFEVASRLSYFLWSSMPDDELLTLAENDRLLDHDILRQQIARMLKDEKASSLSANFASQWLNLRNLKDVRPNPDVFPEFDDALRSAMASETEALFRAVVNENRSVDDFLMADFTFVNERLAKHYGISGVSGDGFVRVSLDGTNRAGVLTHASILTLTSNPARTSPVKRGKWIMENILGEAPPPPPPAVPELEATAKASPGLSLREQLALHRADPGCASCHKTMDPLGLGLENFDAVGRWRETDGDKAVDASGELPSGEKFQGSLELMGILNARKQQFHRALTERMMVYALGRGLEYYDKCVVDETVKTMNQHGNRFSSLIEGIVLSDSFLKRSRTRDKAIASN
ncbi:MAG: DUF1592 domain-containing protein [Planctomycetaceae bacterium]|nr:DUF1592 domain-containing protein [Planctomycetaceae bacterium]